MGVEATGDRVRGESSSSKPNRFLSSVGAGVEWLTRGLGTLKTGVAAAFFFSRTAVLWMSLALREDRGESSGCLMFSFSPLEPAPYLEASLSSTLMMSSEVLLSWLTRTYMYIVYICIQYVPQPTH